MYALYIAVFVLIIAISVPLIMGMVPRNHWYGFRTTKTLSSDSVWYQANRIGGKYFIVAALVQLAVLFVMHLAWPQREDELINTYGAVLTIVPLLIAVVIWFLRVRRLG